MDFPIKNGDFPISYVAVYQRVHGKVALRIMETRGNCSAKFGGIASIKIINQPFYRNIMGDHGIY